MLSHGSVETAERATDVWEAQLAEFVPPPPLADDRREAMEDFVERRVSEGGALPD